MFSTAIQRRLGEAVLVPDGDCLYVGNSRWLFLLERPEDHVPEEILEYVRDSHEDSDRFVDWSILNAIDIDWLNETFLKYGTRKARPTRLESHAHGLPSNVSQIRNMFERHVLHFADPRLNLLEKYRSGEMLTRYGDYFPGSSQPKKVSKSLSGMTALYRGDGVVYGIPSDIIRTMDDLDLSLFVSLRKTGELPVCGGIQEDLGIMFVCSPSHRLGIHETPEGKKIFSSAEDVCWHTVESGIKQIQANASLFDPSNYDQSSIVREIMELDEHFPTVGVDVLRWNSIPDDEIFEILEEAQREAWPKIHLLTMDSAERLLSRITELENSDRELHNWTLESWWREFKSLCLRVERLKEVMPDPLDISPLEDLAEAMKRYPEEDE